MDKNFENKSCCSKSYSYFIVYLTYYPNLKVNNNRKTNLLCIIIYILYGNLKLYFLLLFCIHKLISKHLYLYFKFISTEFLRVKNSENLLGLEPS